MTSNARPSARLLGSLRSAGGKGVVRIEDRYDTDIDDLWSAVTDPSRLARWFGQVEGDLRPGGEFRLSVEWDGNGRVEACEPPRRLRVTWRESDESFRKGRGVPPFDATIEATLTPEGNQISLVVEVAGMPLDKIAFYGAGWQIHAENLAVHIAGDERGDTEARWDELVLSTRPWRPTSPRAKEHPMTSNAHPDTRILGSLRSADGKGVVRMEDRFDTDIADVWSALTDPSRLARWYGEVEGDLRVGGEYRARLFATGWEGTGRIEACEPPHRLLVSAKEPEAVEGGLIEVTLAADGGGTTLVWEERGMPLEMIAGYGAGIQIHVEDLGAHLAGPGRVDAQARFRELHTAYKALAVDVS